MRTLRTFHELLRVMRTFCEDFEDLSRTFEGFENLLGDFLMTPRTFRGPFDHR